VGLEGGHQWRVGADGRAAATHTLGWGGFSAYSTPASSPGPNAHKAATTVHLPEPQASTMVPTPGGVRTPPQDGWLRDKLSGMPADAEGGRLLGGGLERHGSHPSFLGALPGGAGEAGDRQAGGVPTKARSPGKRSVRANPRYFSATGEGEDDDEDEEDDEALPAPAAPAAGKKAGGDAGAGKRKGTGGGAKAGGGPTRPGEAGQPGGAAAGRKGGAKRGDPAAADGELGVKKRKKHHNPWTPEETEALVDGVTKCGGGKWADIKKLGLKAIERRSAVDLKDKWRNLTRVAKLPIAALRSVDKRRDLPIDLLLRVRKLAELASVVRRRPT